MVDFLDLPLEVLAIIADHVFKGVIFEPKPLLQASRKVPQQALPNAFSLLLVTKKSELNLIAKKSLMTHGTFVISSLHQHHIWKNSLSFSNAAYITRLRLGIYLHGELETTFIPQIARKFNNLRYLQIGKICCGCWDHASVEHVIAGTRPKGGIYGDGPCSSLANLVVSHLLGKHKLVSEDAAVVSMLNKLRIDVDNVFLYCRTSVHAPVQKAQVS